MSKFQSVQIKNFEVSKFQVTPIFQKYRTRIFWIFHLVDFETSQNKGNELTFVSCMFCNTSAEKTGAKVKQLAGDPQICENAIT